MDRKEEIDIKEKKVLNLMEELNLNAILLKTQANFSWFTGGGINEVAITENQGVASILVTREKRYIVSNNIESLRMMEEEGLKELGFSLIEYNWFESSEEDALLKLFPKNQIGCDLEGYGYINCSKRIAELRYQLLEAEIERYLWLGRKTSIAIETVLNMARPGVRECLLTGEILRILWNDRIDSVCNQSGSDERTRKYRHAIPTEKRINNYIMLNVNARKWGLVTAITRTAYLGKRDKKLEKQYRDTVEIECGLIAASRPNTPLKELFGVVKSLYEKYGYPNEWKHHHQGGAQGYKNREYVIMPNSKEKILRNQCFCWNPTIAGNEYGTKSEDAFIATDNGPLMVTGPALFPVIKLTIGGIEFNRPDILWL